MGLTGAPSRPAQSYLSAIDLARDGPGPAQAMLWRRGPSRPSAFLLTVAESLIACSHGPPSVSAGLEVRSKGGGGGAKGSKAPSLGVKTRKAEVAREEWRGERGGRMEERVRWHLRSWYATGLRTGLGPTFPLTLSVRRLSPPPTPPPRQRRRG